MGYIYFKLLRFRIMKRDKKRLPDLLGFQNLAGLKSENAEVQSERRVRPTHLIFSFPTSNSSVKRAYYFSSSQTAIRTINGAWDAPYARYLSRQKMVFLNGYIIFLEVPYSWFYSLFSFLFKTMRTTN